MAPTLSILIVDENPARAAIIEDGLREAGCARIAVVAEMHGLMRQIEAFAPDVVVVDLENPDRDRLECFFQISRSTQRPVAMFVDRADARSIDAAIEAGVSAYVVDGLKKERIKPIIDMAVSRFNAFSRLSRELQEARDELADRKVIDRAKGILMQMRQIDEASAYKLLRQTAMNENRRIADVARSLITARSLLED